jgi:hypothetical protein
MEGCDALKSALADELALDTTTRMIAAFGGEARCLERFLLARKHDIAAAAEAFKATAEFRRTHGLDKEASFEPSAEVKERVGALWPGAYCGSTADGSNVQLFRFGGLDVGALLEQATETEFREYYLWWMERSLALQVDAGTTAGGAPRGQVEVYDCTGLSIAALAYGAGREGIRMLSRVLSIGQAHYPENLRTALFINSPLGFASVWSLVSTALSESPPSHCAQCPVPTDGEAPCALQVSTALSESTVGKIDIRRDDGAEQLEALLGGPKGVAAMHASLAMPEAAKGGSWGAWATSGWS